MDHNYIAKSFLEFYKDILKFNNNLGPNINEAI